MYIPVCGHISILLQTNNYTAPYDSGLMGANFKAYDHIIIMNILRQQI
jgi:hypothetical protein